MISVIEQLTAQMALEICRALVAQHPTLDHAQYLALERAVDKAISGQLPEETEERDGTEIYTGAVERYALQNTERDEPKSNRHY